MESGGLGPPLFEQKNGPSLSKGAESVHHREIEVILP
jgi:hypothetical protein